MYLKQLSLLDIRLKTFLVYKMTSTIHMMSKKTYTFPKEPSLNREIKKKDCKLGIQKRNMNNESYKGTLIRSPNEEPK